MIDMAADGGRQFRVEEVPAQETPTPALSRSMSKLHPIPSLDMIRQFQFAQFETKISTLIVQQFTVGRLAEISHYVSQHHSIDEWVDFHNGLAIELMHKPLFVGLVPSAGHDMTYDVFSGFYAPDIVQQPDVTMAMLHFFRYLSKKMASGGIN